MVPLKISRLLRTLHVDGACCSEMVPDGICDKFFNIIMSPVYIY